MATSFEVFYLGSLAPIDPVEGDQNLSAAAVNSWLGTYGSVGDGLSHAGNIKQLAIGTTGVAGGQQSAAYDMNNNAANETFTIDGVTKTFDAAMIFNATITYPDGSTAAITAVLAQDTNGDVYLVPETTNNADQQALMAGPIQSITLISPIYGNGATQGWNLLADRFAADFIPCFTRGAIIATPRGEVAIETLRRGDRVFTRDHGIQEIAWIGGRELSVAELEKTLSYQPIMVRAGALGPNLPDCDMVLSPNHRILMTSAQNQIYFDESEVLVAAKHLTHLSGIDQVTARKPIEYIHIMFAQHEVILSDGTWSESFQPGDYSLKGVGTMQRDEIVALFPELGSEGGLCDYGSARLSLRSHEAKLIT